MQMEVPVPKEISDVLPKLTLSFCAKIELMSLEEKYGFTFDKIVDAVARSVADLLTCDYLKRNKWFAEQPMHLVNICEIRKDGQTITPRMVYRKADHMLLLELEVKLPESYHTQRVIEEAKVIYFV